MAEMILEKCEILINEELESHHRHGTEYFGDGHKLGFQRLDTGMRNNACSTIIVTSRLKVKL